MMQQERIAQLTGGGDFLVLVRAVGEDRYVYPESLLKKEPSHQGILIDSFLAHSPYWEPLLPSQ